MIKIVTIEREYGCGGGEIAQLLAKQLGWKLWDELLTEDSLVLVEWGEKFKSIKKKSTGEIAITSTGGDARKITVSLKEQS